MGEEELLWCEVSLDTLVSVSLWLLFSALSVLARFMVRVDRHCCGFPPVYFSNTSLNGGVHLGMI